MPVSDNCNTWDALTGSCLTCYNGFELLEGSDLVQKLEANPNALGIFGFSFLDQNSDKVQGSIVEGVEPEFETIASKAYPISRPLYFYVKKAHMGVVPGIEGYLAEFSSEKAWGEEGYLADKGMIPMPDELRAKFASDIKNKTPLTADQFK